MFGSFRKGEANDPKVYTASVAKMLAQYDVGVIDYVTDCITGLPSKKDFLPNVREVKEACDERAGEIQRQIDRRLRAQQQIEERSSLPTRETYVPPPGSRLISWRDQCPENQRKPIGPFEKAGDRWNRHIPAEDQ